MFPTCCSPTSHQSALFQSNILKSTVFSILFLEVDHLLHMYKYRGMREEKDKYKFSSFKYQELKYSVLRSKFDQRAVQYFPPPFFVRLMYKSRCYLRNSVCQTTKNQCSDTKTGMFQYLTLTSGSDQRRAASHELN